MSLYTCHPGFNNPWEAHIPRFGRPKLPAKCDASRALRESSFESMSASPNRNACHGQNDAWLVVFFPTHLKISSSNFWIICRIGFQLKKWRKHLRKHHRVACVRDQCVRTLDASVSMPQCFAVVLESGGPWWNPGWDQVMDKWERPWWDDEACHYHCHYYCHYCWWKKSG